jgi:hypothetical protein
MYRRLAVLITFLLLAGLVGSTVLWLRAQQRQYALNRALIAALVEGDDNRPKTTRLQLETQPLISPDLHSNLSAKRSIPMEIGPRFVPALCINVNSCKPDGKFASQLCVSSVEGDLWTVNRNRVG